MNKFDIESEARKRRDTRRNDAQHVAVYCTTYCNHEHRLIDGKPVDHECYILPSKALELERADKIGEAIMVIQAAKPLQIHRGIKS
jgi:hypothetical protein